VTLYLVHHGDAVPPEVDAQRPLSELGRRAVAALAAEAAARGVKPEVVWHSGKLRARQTAETFWRACNPFAEFSAMRGLQPTDPAEWICDRVTGEARDVMCVGHLPSLARIMRRLVMGDEDAPLAWPPHGLVALEPGEAGRWVECWRLEPSASDAD
jgi:phosphohistidine phosphatase